MWILQEESSISRTSNIHERNSNEFRQNTSSTRVIYIEECQESAIISRVSQLLSILHHELFKRDTIADRTIQEKQNLWMRRKTAEIIR